MRVTYTLGVEDWVCYFVHYSWQTLKLPPDRWWRGPLTILLAGVIFLATLAVLGLMILVIVRYVMHAFPSTLDAEQLDTVALGVAVAVVLLSAVVGVIVTRRQQLPALREAAKPSEERLRNAARQCVEDAVKAGTICLDWRITVSLDAGGTSQKAELCERSGPAEVLHHSELRVSWSLVEAVEVRGQQAFFRLKGFSWWMVPCTAFADEDAFQAFVQMATRFRSAALASTALTTVVPAESRESGAYQARPPALP